MSLDFTATLQDRDFDIALAVGDGETIAVLGPNGSGKSTLLSVLAGLVKPDTGRAMLDDRVLFDLDASGSGPWLPPHARGISMLAQDALLFPHLSVLDNVAFGPRSKGLSRHAANERATEWLERVDATGLATRRPAQLSGGQAQRIAVARALATDPALLLLDEPMAALDVSVAPALRRMLREVLADRSAIIVTHDVLDAFTLADRVVVLETGRIVDVGPTRNVLEQPTTRFAAGLAALNLLVGAAEGQSVRTRAGHLITARLADEPGPQMGVSVRPSRVTVSTTEPLRDAATGNVIPATVIDLEPRGDLVRVRSEELAADVPPGVIARLDLAPGSPVWFEFAAEDAIAYRL